MLCPSLMAAPLQVAQLAEQQVQGCTLRLNRLETEVAQRSEMHRLQHDTQASTVASLSTQLVDLQASLNHMHSQFNNAPTNEQLTATVAELQSNMHKMQAAFADATEDRHRQQELHEQVSELQRQVGFLQESVGGCSKHEENSLSLSSQVKGLLPLVDAVHSGQQAHVQLSTRVDEFDEPLTSVQSALKQFRNAESSSAIQQVRQQVDQLANQCRQLETDVASDRHSSASVSGLQQEWSVMKTQLGHLQTATADRAAVDSNASVLGLQQELSVMKTQVSHLQAAAADQAAVHSQMAQLQTHLTEPQDSAKSQVSHASLNKVKQDVTALRAQVSQLQGSSTKHAAEDRWQRDMQSVQSELAKCTEASRRAEAAVAEHALQLKQAELQLSAMQKELAALSTSLPQHVAQKSQVI